MIAGLPWWAWFWCVLGGAVVVWSAGFVAGVGWGMASEVKRRRMADVAVRRLVRGRV